jgi:hypothetical protein
MDAIEFPLEDDLSDYDSDTQAIGVESPLLTQFRSSSATGPEGSPHHSTPNSPTAC